MAVFVHGLVDRADHVLVGARGVGHVLEHLGNRLATDGQAVTVQQAGVEQHLHDLRDAAGAVQVDREVFAAGFQVAQHGCLLAHALEIVDGPLHFGRMRDRQEVQHRVGGPTGGHDHRHRVFDRLLGHDVARLDVLLDGLDQHLG
ncbi:hypothetical protein D9M69_609330 [compost metagenome]